MLYVSVIDSKREARSNHLLEFPHHLLPMHDSDSILKMP